jgi:hypothetical protein
LALINCSLPYLTYEVKTDGAAALYLAALLKRSAATTTLSLVPRANAATGSMCTNLVKAITPKSTILKKRDN